MHDIIFPKLATRNFLLQVQFTGLKPVNGSKLLGLLSKGKVINDTFRKHVFSGHFRDQKFLMEVDRNSAL